MKISEKDVSFRATVAKQCEIRGYKKYQVAEKMGISKSTFYAKMRNPGTFSVTEMRNICSVLRFSVEEKTSIL